MWCVNQAFVDHFVIHNCPSSITGTYCGQWTWYYWNDEFGTIHNVLCVRTQIVPCCVSPAHCPFLFTSTWSQYCTASNVSSCHLNAALNKSWNLFDNNFMLSHFFFPDGTTINNHFWTIIFAVIGFMKDRILFDKLQNWWSGISVCSERCRRTILFRCFGRTAKSGEPCIFSVQFIYLTCSQLNSYEGNSWLY